MDRNRTGESGRFALVYWSMTLQDVLHIEKEALRRYLLKPVLKESRNQ
jgi:hypothetical protein